MINKDQLKILDEQYQALNAKSSATLANKQASATTEHMKGENYKKLKEMFVEELVPKLEKTIKNSNLFENMSEHEKAFLPGNIASTLFDRYFVSRVEAQNSNQPQNDSKQDDEIIRTVIEGSLLIAVGKPIHGTTVYSLIIELLSKVCKEHFNNPSSEKNQSVINKILPPSKAEKAETDNYEWLIDWHMRQLEGPDYKKTEDSNANTYYISGEDRERIESERRREYYSNL